VENRTFFPENLDFLESKISATGFTTPKLRTRLTPLPGRQRRASVAVGDDGGRVVVQEWNRNILKSSVFSREWNVAEESASGG